MKKKKSQIGINLAFAASAPGCRICLLEFAIILKMKDNKIENSSGEMKQLQMNPP